jgi:hypothetical protein
MFYGRIFSWILGNGGMEDKIPDRGEEALLSLAFIG